MRMFNTSKNKYLSNDMNIFGTCSIPLIATLLSRKPNIMQSSNTGLFLMVMPLRCSQIDHEPWDNLRNVECHQFCHSDHRLYCL